jgi:hypothetical protein
MIYIKIYNMIWLMWYDIRYDIIDMISYMRYDMIDIWHDWYGMTWLIWYDMIDMIYEVC